MNGARFMVALTEPGSADARVAGCTCPEQDGPRPLPGGGCAWTRDPDCPLHPFDRTAGPGGDRKVTRNRDGSGRFVAMSEARQARACRGEL